jgi:predicted GNAT family acetyltransferase
VRAAIDDARESNLIVVPLCPFARAWLERHPDVAATARIDWSAAGG